MSIYVLRSSSVQPTRNKKDQRIDELIDGHRIGVHEWRWPSVIKLWYFFPDTMVRSHNSVRNKWHMSYEFLVYLHVSCRYTHELIGDRLFDVHDVKLGWSQPIGVVLCMFLRAGGGVCSILCNVRVGCGV